MQIQNIQALRAIAALMVLIAHLCLVEQHLTGGVTAPGQLRIGVTGVDLFFLISGFVMATVSGRTPKDKAGVSRFAYNRAARIYPLYWIATLAALAVYLGGDMLFNEAYEVNGLAASLLLLPQASLPILTVGWTLIHEMYFYLMISLILILAPNRKILGLAIWGAVVLLGYATGLVNANPWTKLIFNPLTFEFLAGAAVAYLVNITAGRWGPLAIAAGCLIFAFQFFNFGDEDWAALSAHGVRAATYTAPFALILYGAAAIEAANNKLAPRWLSFIGDASYSLYLFHLPILMVVTKLIATLMGDRGVADNLTMMVLGGGMAMTATLIIHLYLERPMLMLTRRLGDRIFSRAQSQRMQTDRSW